MKVKVYKFVRVLCITFIIIDIIALLCLVCLCFSQGEYFRSIVGAAIIEWQRNIFNFKNDDAMVLNGFILFFVIPLIVFAITPDESQGKTSKLFEDEELKGTKKRRVIDFFRRNKKKILIIFGSLIIVLLLLKCLLFKSFDRLQGTWKNSDDDISGQVIIDGNKVSLSVNGESEVGTVDRIKKDMIFKDHGKITKAKYVIIGDHLDMTIDGSSVEFNKASTKFKSVQLQGTWKGLADDLSYQAVIDGNKVSFSVDGESEVGTVDRIKKDMIFKDHGKTTKAKYVIVGDQLNVTVDGRSIAFSKANVKAKKPVTSSEQPDKEYYGQKLGDYEVGADMNPGRYDVCFNCYDNNCDSGKGTGTVVITSSTGSKREYKFFSDSSGVSSDKNIILKNGDMVTLDSSGSESDFDFTEPD